MGICWRNTHNPNQQCSVNKNGTQPAWCSTDHNKHGHQSELLWVLSISMRSVNIRPCSCCRKSYLRHTQMSVPRTLQPVVREPRNILGRPIHFKTRPLKGRIDLPAFSRTTRSRLVIADSLAFPCSTHHNKRRNERWCPPEESVVYAVNERHGACFPSVVPRNDYKR